jgi:hypothetical protein
MQTAAQIIRDTAFTRIIEERSASTEIISFNWHAPNSVPLMPVRRRYRPYAIVIA